jgi:hypothetical protein
MPGIISPNPRNYQIGKGFAIFTPEGGIATHLGNMPKFVYSPAVTVLPHFSSMAGTSVQDFSVITREGGSIAADLEEMTAFNLSLFFLGTINSTNPSAVTVGIYDQLQQIAGRLQFYATNNVGPRWQMDYTKVLVSPTGQFNPISEGYNAMTVTMTHVIDDNGLFGSMTLQPDVKTVAPQNVLLPFIDGPLFLGDEPAFAQVGEVMTANVGQWIGAQGFTFQWKKAGVPIAGAISKTYIPVSGDAAAILTVTITGTNGIGSTVATSGPTLAVHP